jgi:hypothetical protein
MSCCWITPFHPWKYLAKNRWKILSLDPFFLFQSYLSQIYLCCDCSTEWPKRKTERTRGLLWIAENNSVIRKKYQNIIDLLEKMFLLWSSHADTTDGPSLAEKRSVLQLFT